MSNHLRAIVHASEILTGSGIRKKDGRKVKEEDLGRISDGALVYSVKKRGKIEIPDRVEWVGPTSSFPPELHSVKKRDLKLKRAVVPGFVDCHNHLLFAGDRSDEFAMRCSGVSYQEIAERGGGIQATVQATRATSPRELERFAAERLKELYSYGVRTVEVKSGYGLSVESEFRLLELIPKLQKKFPEMTLTATFLGAHAFPFDRSREEYLKDIVETMLPEIARRKLADACDIFVDQGYYSVEDGKKVLGKARELGLNVKVHADELTNTESAAFAVEQGALSADHLLRISEYSIRKMAASNTVAVLLPGTALSLRVPYAPARRLIDAGAAVAIATDFNPGTCMSLSLPLMMTLAALYLEMSRAEIFASVTYSAAKALGLAHRKGTLEPGLDADFAILPFLRFEEVYYHLGWSSARKGL